MRKSFEAGVGVHDGHAKIFMLLSESKGKGLWRGDTLSGRI